MPKAKYTKPSTQLDLEARQKADYVPEAQLSPGEDPKPSENGYVGVDPIYQTFANPTEKPMRAEKGSLAKIEENVYDEDADFDAGATPEGEVDSEEEEDEDEGTGSTGGSTTTPTTPSTPSTPPSS